MTEYEEQWEVYPSRISDEFAMFAVNLGPQPDAPYDNLRWLNIVRLNFAPLPSGMPSSDTNHLLYEVEDLIATKASARGGIQVGRLTVSGRRELFFYTATNDTELMLRDLSDEFGDLEVDAVSQLDAEWKVYFDFLYPKPVDFQRINNQRIIRLLAEHGDVETVVRQIDHFAFFPDEATRKSFARQLAEGGFAIEHEQESDEGDRRFGLSFSSRGPVDLATIDALTIALFTRIEELGGTYDGWGCGVKKHDGDEEE